MTTEIAEKPATNGTMTIKQRLNDPAFHAEIAKAMPEHCKPERMARVALTALTRTPKLANCDQPSFFRCLLDLSQWGLEPDGRRAHLIPFENRKRGVTECQLIIDYKGLVELAYRSGAVTSIHADVVHRGDLFAYSAGYITEHIPWFLRDPNDRPAKEGDIYAAYCIVQFKDGRARHEIMSRDEVESVRKRSRAGSSGPWVTDWNEMAKKTVFRRCSKWLPLSAEVLGAFDGDDDRLQGLPAPHEPRKSVKAIDMGELLTVNSHADYVQEAIEGPQEGVDEPSSESGIDEPDPDSTRPADAASEETIFRSKIAAEFGMLHGAAAIKSRIDAYCGPESTLQHQWMIDIASEEGQKRLEKIKK